MSTGQNKPTCVWALPLASTEHMTIYKCTFYGDGLNRDCSDCQNYDPGYGGEVDDG